MPGAGDGPDRYVRVIDGVVQGLVIGDHNTVTQNFRVDPDALPLPREAPATPFEMTGRAEQVARVVQHLTTPGSDPVTALYGLGGVGKSTVAAAVCAEPAVESAFPDGTFWIDARRTDPMDSLGRVAKAFAQDVSHTVTLEARQAVLRSILSEKSVLIVVDDVWDLKEAEAFQPASDSSATLVTTRNGDLAYHLTNEVELVEPLGVKTASQLIAEYVPVREPGDEHIIATLVESLGGLPLALSLVGSRARKEARRPGFSWHRFSQRFAAAAARLDLGHGGDSVRSAMNQTWRLSLDDAGRTRFTLLGIFEPRDLLTGEIAAAWNLSDDEVAASDALAEMIDLALVTPLDPVTIRVHPLVRDYAVEVLSAIPDGVQVSAHTRVADYHYERAPSQLVSLTDVEPVLLSHVHAWLARDSERAKRVFPWFSPDGASQFASSEAVPGFLREQGSLVTLVRHREIELNLAQDAQSAAWAAFWLADSLADMGQLERADDVLATTLPLLDDNPLLARRVTPLHGQVLRSLGKYEAAIRSFERSIEVAHALGGEEDYELVSLLNLADVHVARSADDDLRQALELVGHARLKAREMRDASTEIMALERQARWTMSADPATAADAVREATHALGALADGRDSGLFGRVRGQGARYLTNLGKLATELAAAGLPTRPEALQLLLAAVEFAAKDRARIEWVRAMYSLGDAFELATLRELDPDLNAAWACYALADAVSSALEVVLPDAPAADAIRMRIRPRILPAKRDEVAALIQAEPVAVIESTLRRLGLDQSLALLPDLAEDGGIASANAP